MPIDNDQLVDDIWSAVRRVVRAIDLQSKQLIRDHKVTGPQLVTLRKIARLGPISVTALAKEVNLSQSTVTGILLRLEQQGLIKRERKDDDRRTVTSTITVKGGAVVKDTPALLEDRFRRKLLEMKEWEQTQMLAGLQRIASMMEEDEIIDEIEVKIPDAETGSQETELKQNRY
ncbi:MAG: MarR family transcriptional regulator [Pseudomonadales bacterium]|nr:MarR family transcriptional regulator [Pseudomonadales bacterium]